ncbi:alginate lyase family protein [Mesobacillus sp. AQ2]|uniref:alginate lyase family protein n=1 Tax=Mesobacillus sp. AQ2 TaxID=3043332 RepID=UPI0024C18464|nr:alginate lyase family protein [Mesobacillus sp. AQ2]WHX40261.1 alginate lyase family protein [Mesobacillus sp. AQ2]
MKEFSVPFVYKEMEGDRKNKESLVTDVNIAYELALFYQITGEEKYAEASIRIIKAWYNHTKYIAKKRTPP